MANRNLHLIKCRGKNTVVTYDEDYNIWEETSLIVRATRFKGPQAASAHLNTVARDLCVPRNQLEVVATSEQHYKVR